jgi:hypothetical protein
MDTDKNTDMHGEINMETKTVDDTKRNTDNDIITNMHTDMNTGMDMDSVKHTDKDTAMDAERTSIADGQEHRAWTRISAWTGTAGMDMDRESRHRHGQGHQA